MDSPSAPSRGRGGARTVRGRGRGRSPSEVEDPALAFVPAPAPIASTSTAAPVESPSAATAKPKQWRPKKYKKREVVECVRSSDVADLRMPEVEVKPQIPAQPEPSSSRRKPELVHQDSGAFAQVEKGKAKLAGFNAGRSDDGDGGGGSGHWSRARTGPNELCDNAPPEDGEDVEENQGHFEYADSDDSQSFEPRRIRQNRLLDDIWRESDMAPVVPLHDGEPARLQRRKIREPAAMKMDEDVDEKPQAVISAEELLRMKEDRNRQSVGDFLLENMDGERPVYTVMQFPREFPDFVERSIDADADVKMNGLHEDEDVKPDIKPYMGELPSAADRYLQGGWEGFGKRATKKHRTPMGGTSGAAGRIGKLQVLKSGKVRLILGNTEAGDLISYDILPGAAPAFQQYLASIAVDDADRQLHSTEPLNDEPMSVDDDEDEDRKPQIAPPSLVMLGNVQRKFIARPDIPSLLDAMANEREQAEERARIKQIKEEETLNDFDVTANASASTSATQIKPKVQPRRKKA